MVNATQNGRQVPDTGSHRPRKSGAPAVPPARAFPAAGQPQSGCHIPIPVATLVQKNLSVESGDRSSGAAQRWPAGHALSFRTPATAARFSRVRGKRRPRAAAKTLF